MFLLTLVACASVETCDYYVIDFDLSLRECLEARQTVQWAVNPDRHPVAFLTCERSQVRSDSR